MAGKAFQMALRAVTSLLVRSLPRLSVRGHRGTLRQGLEPLARQLLKLLSPEQRAFVEGEAGLALPAEVAEQLWERHKRGDACDMSLVPQGFFGEAMEAIHINECSPC